MQRRQESWAHRAAHPACRAPAQGHGDTGRGEGQAPRPPVQRTELSPVWTLCLSPWSGAAISGAGLWLQRPHQEVRMEPAAGWAPDRDLGWGEGAVGPQGQESPQMEPQGLLRGCREQRE